MTSAHEVGVELGDRSYRIRIGYGLLDDRDALAALVPGRHVLVVSDANIAPRYLPAVPLRSHRSRNIVTEPRSRPAHRKPT